MPRSWASEEDRRAFYKARYEADPEKYRALARAEYHRTKTTLTPEQKARKREASRRSALKHPKRAWAWKLKFHYGITPEEYYTILDAQGGGCAICGGLQSKNGRALHVDHDHSSGKVRGILCDRCNTSIGKFDESPTLLRKAAAYVEAYKEDW